MHGTDTNRLRVVRMGIDSHHQAIAFMRRDCHVCRSEGFNALSRVQLTLGPRQVLATLDIVDNDLLQPDTIGVSESAWALLQAKPGDSVAVAHPPALESMTHVRGKIYGKPFTRDALISIVRDVVSGSYSDAELAVFITVCAEQLDVDEITWLTEAMVEAGERVTWPEARILDKHCLGGLPGNRTTPLVVALVAANGLCIPKTSSRAITSPAGTADTMETLAPVRLDLPTMRRVVNDEGGCIVWGGAVNLSPADDIFIRVERVLDIDSRGQMVASVLSKKIAAGATDVLIDIPVGPTAKVRTREAAEDMGSLLQEVGRRLGLNVRTWLSDGSAPIGYGIGPALEAHDLLAVFQELPEAPGDLRSRALALAGQLLEMGGAATAGMGTALARKTLESGAAWRKFQSICAAQGGMRTPPVARHQRQIFAERDGYLQAFDNRILARLAKLAGAPAAAAAGIYLHVSSGQRIQKDQPLFTVHAESKGELAYAVDYYRSHRNVMRIAE